MALTEGLQLKRFAGFRNKSELVFDGSNIQSGVVLTQLANVDLERGTGFGAAAFKQPYPSAGDIIGAEKVAAATDRPGHRRGVKCESLFNFVQQLERVAALAVHFVDESDDRNISQPADLEQLSRPR